METHTETERLRRRLVETITVFAPVVGKFETGLDGLILYRRAAPTTPTPCFYEPALTVVAQGGKAVIVNGARLVYDQAHCLLTAVDLPVVSQVVTASADVPYLALSLRLDMVLVGEMLAADRDRVSPGRRAASDGAPALAVERIDAALLGAVVRLVGLLSAPHDVAVLRPLYEREIVYRLLQGAQGAQLARLASADSRQQRVARAVAWLKRHYAEPCRVEDLAEHVGMSVSSLHHSFKAVTAQSPVQFLKHLRLQQARRLMLTGADAASAGYEVGYESPSHFSREYRRLFGTAPMRDVSALREWPQD